MSNCSILMSVQFGQDERLEAALTALGRTDVEVHMRLLKSVTDIEGTGFAGSPTITVNGSDIFP